MSIHKKMIFSPVSMNYISQLKFEISVDSNEHLHKYILSIYIQILLEAITDVFLNVWTLLLCSLLRYHKARSIQ